MADEIDAPLGQKKSRALPHFVSSLLRFRTSFAKMPVISLTGVLFAISFLVIAGFVLRVVLVNDPLGGRPSATVDISSSRYSNPVAMQATEEPEEPAAATAMAQNGDGPSITILGDDVPSGQNMEAPVGIRGLTEFGVVPELAEETQNGPIPQVAPDGATPFETYARASITPASAGGKPLVAIVVTGLGLNESGTMDAIQRLPDNVTLAFAPYGQSLQRTAAAARGEGHEILLEVPLEPFDYPDNDPGPQTLLTGQPPRANLDRLFWLMSRVGGYVGLINNMGARFTSSAADFSPFMEELGTRGLGYVDDGSSNRSLAPQLADTNHVPFGRGNRLLDATPSRPAILAALNDLEADATRNGTAIGIISALPISIKAISEWAANLEDKNIVLVPVSALMN